MSNPLQHYFAQLQKEQGDLILVADSARMVPRSKSFTVSSSNNDVRKVMSRTHSDSLCPPKKFPSLLSRASMAASTKNATGKLQETGSDSSSLSLLKNSTWSSPTPSMNKQKLFESIKDKAPQNVLRMDSPSPIYERKHLSPGTIGKSLSKVAQWPVAEEEETAVPAETSCTPTSLTRSIIGFDQMASPCSVRWDVELAKALLEERSTKVERPPVFPSYKTLGPAEPRPFSQAWFQELDDVLQSHVETAGR